MSFSADPMALSGHAISADVSEESKDDVAGSTDNPQVARWVDRKRNLAQVLTPPADPLHGQDCDREYVPPTLCC